MLIFSANNSVIHLMCVITLAHASTCTTSLMCVKNMPLTVWDIRMKKTKEQKYQIE